MHNAVPRNSISGHEYKSMKSASKIVPGGHAINSRLIKLNHVHMHES